VINLNYCHRCLLRKSFCCFGFRRRPCLGLNFSRGWYELLSCNCFLDLFQEWFPNHLRGQCAGSDSAFEGSCFVGCHLPRPRGCPLLPSSYCLNPFMHLKALRVSLNFFQLQNFTASCTIAGLDHCRYFLKSSIWMIIFGF
jgi:hypothetical protein